MASGFSIRARVILLGVLFLILLTPWVARVIFADGGIAFGGPATYTGTVCEAVPEGEPTVCVASFGAVMVVSLLAILLAGSATVVGAWKRVPNALKLAGVLAPVGWLFLVFDEASRGSFLAEYQFTLTGLGASLTTGWVLVYGVFLVGGAIGLWRAASRVESAPVETSA